MPSANAEKLSLKARSSLCEERQGGAPGSTCLLLEWRPVDAPFLCQALASPLHSVSFASCVSPCSQLSFA